MQPRRHWRVAVKEQVELGVAELVPDPGRPEGWTLLVDDVAQSYVDLGDPTHLEFEYVRQVTAVVDVAAPARRPLRVLHLGGGAFTLPRYVAATRPGSAQVVVERDAALAALVQRILPLPADAGVEVRVADARQAVEAAAGGEYDLVVADVYTAAQMPLAVTTAEFAGHAARVLKPGGLYAVNVTDLPMLTFSRIQAATLRRAFGDVCILGEPGMPPGRRFGNLVMVAAPHGRPGGLPLARLRAATARDRLPGRLPGRVLHGAILDRFIDGIRPATDAQPATCELP